ncbi:MAG: sulfatase-like hydrolase/transferase [Planctomycetaceae bacterium]|nr:sulfatase-like hydrolase/transferase [Planctomycetaceae bacterium]
MNTFPWFRYQPDRSGWVYPLTSLLIACSLTSYSTECEARRPNFVIILADDLGYGDLGCYGNSVPTPELDRLAQQGIRFTDFHSNGAMCTPTRTALLTGRYQQRFGNEFEGPLSGATQRDRGLPLSAVTIAEALKPLGYATAMYGKWHLGYQLPYLPTRQGFDQFVGLTAGDGDHHTQIDRWGHEDWWQNEQPLTESGYTTELITKHSCRFIEQNRERPFFLYVPHLGIHFPWQGPNDPPHRVKGMNYTNDKWGRIRDTRNVRPHVQSMIHALDQSVGAIINKLRSLKLRENTLVLFLSDNGGYLSYGKTHDKISSNGELRGQKGDLYEGGHRVPAIAYWPSRIRPTVRDETLMTCDILPTLIELAEAEAKIQFETDGISFAPVLQGATIQLDRDLFWRDKGSYAVRRDAWKLVSHRGQRPELFNLRQDPNERVDRAKQHPQRVGELKNAYQRWATDVAFRQK